MAGDSKKDQKEVAEIAGDLPATSSEEKTTKKKKRGVISRIWNTLFRLHGDDFEKRLQHISKEEAAIVARLKKRSISRRGIIRNIIVLSALFEVMMSHAFSYCALLLSLFWISNLFNF